MTDDNGQTMIPGTERRPSCGVLDRDIRYTPAFCLDELLKAWPPPTWAPLIEPAAGNGALVAPLWALGYDVLAVELREYAADELREACPLATVHVGDWITLARDWGKPDHALAPTRFGVELPALVTNPPYSIGVEFARACLSVRPVYCALLLRLNHLGSATWAPFLKAHPFQGLVILGSKRPAFVGVDCRGSGATDSSEYAWVIWATHIQGGAGAGDGSMANVWIA